MKKYSIDTYIFNSPLSRSQIHEILHQRTLIKESLTMEWTDKEFIGRLNDDQFKLIQASFIPYGAACTITGSISPTSEIHITTSLHRALRILLLIWVVAITTVYFVSNLLRGDLFEGLTRYIVAMTIATLLFRLFLHGSYVLARDKAVKRIKEILQAA